jgi:CheY-like chemotaxis protein
MPRRPCQILLVEDDPSDRFLIIRALGADYTRNLQTVADGAEALAYLRREAPFEHAPKPDLILLDLKLPKKDGRQVLAEMRADSEWRSIPVIIVTSTDAEDETLKQYAGYANAYVKKSLDGEQFAQTLQRTLHAWVTIIEASLDDHADLPALSAQ